MLNQNNKSKLRHLFALSVCAAAILMSANAQSDWRELTPDQLDAIIVKNADEGALSVEASMVDAKLDPTVFDKDDYRKGSMVRDYQFLAKLSNDDFDKASKLDLPSAPKGSDGEYYLDLDSLYKAVVVKTKLGDSYHNLEAMRFEKKAIDIQRGKVLSKSAPVPKNAPGLYWLEITGVSSAFFYPSIEYVWSSATSTAWNHGGGWVGARTLEYGIANSNATYVCGLKTTEISRLPVTGGGNVIGQERLSYAYVQCPSGS
ncbi:MAG: hypothetical protein HOP02_04520, partial [Methylococcaceae bacterium]|nr:hypothetical protein [Methylococcaceae bacterium]